MGSFNVNEDGFYGNFGGAYVPEILYNNVETLKKTYLEVLNDEAFKKEFHALLRDYVGRPSPLYFAKRIDRKSVV